MYRRVEDFLTDYCEEAHEAQKNWDTLTNSALSVNAKEGFWTIKDHLWHIASIWQYVFVNDLKLWPEDERLDQIPNNAKTLAGFYHDQTEKICHWIKKNWTDEDLAVEIELWGLKMTRGKLLWEVVKHEAHHRGQIFTLMRLAGLRVHGIYGPSKEEVDAMAASGTVSG